MTYTPEITRAVRGNGTQKLYWFPNNYGASVVQNEFSFGGAEGLWELAVIEYDPDKPDSWNLTYDTPITNEVIGHLTEEEIDELLTQIKALPPNNQGEQS
jgi:hypothetical protein